MEALVGVFKQEKALIGAFSVIVKTDVSFAALLVMPGLVSSVRLVPSISNYGLLAAGCGVTPIFAQTDTIVLKHTRAP